MNGHFRFLFVFLCVLQTEKVLAQDNSTTEYRTTQLETMAEKTDSEPEDDSFEIDLEEFSKHPLNLNTAGPDELSQLHMLDALQVSNFLAYRKLLGPLLSIREIQAVPGWDIEIIRRLLPYIKVENEKSVSSGIMEKWKGGDAALLIRASQVLEKSRGLERPVVPGASFYEGSAQKIFIRYTYNYKQLLNYGFTADKDAGEPIFRGAQRYGFDFYSFHFFLKNNGLIRAIAIGDFTVSMGQGLIQWQSFSITKSNQVLAVKRDAAFLRPYHSAGENNFHRGAGISLKKGNWESNLFISTRKISTNRVVDSSGSADVFSSFQNSGYHRTAAEIADRNNTRQLSAGGNLCYRRNQFSLGLNWILYRFSRSFEKQGSPYNLYSLKGKNLKDFSIDYSYSMGNLYLFGELAADHLRHTAFVQGALLSLGENLDLSFLYRKISPAFQSLYSDAFTENSTPNNEEGFYTGFSFMPVPALKADIYYDLFEFPWAKYRVDGPSGGRELFFQLAYQPDKSWHLTSLYKNERKAMDRETLNAPTHELVSPVKRRWLLETEYSITKNLQITSRMEFVWIRLKGIPELRGFLGRAGMGFTSSGFSGNTGVGIFETDDYTTRIYTYEPDLLYNFSLPAFYGQGICYYVNLHMDFSRMFQRSGKHFHVSGWLKWCQRFYPGAVSPGTGLDEIPGDRKSELKGQIMIQW